MPTFTHPPSLPSSLISFITHFYQTSDKPDAVDTYLSFLTPDVEFVMGLNAVRGSAVRKIRENMWGGVATRQHVPSAVYTNADGSELMIHGTVIYGLRNGKKVENVGWAALMVFEEEGAKREEWKMRRYQVWLDGAPLSKALAEQAAAEGQ
ncbi:hypothetical protein AAT19DRAFT_14452 [Rhodotorula toruloides]|uniref:SnoaL-like domain-containing protein n=1 Tax=Rhodotorula toruloides TaxID=5286 RepID=A0A2T0ABQ3_RHOTO|nr:hypothetical protein AAT19DRAFT_14452 [Rhodotorula toruloides]